MIGTEGDSPANLRIKDHEMFFMEDWPKVLLKIAFYSLPIYKTLRLYIHLWSSPELYIVYNIFVKKTKQKNLPYKLNCLKLTTRFQNVYAIVTTYNTFLSILAAFMPKQFTYDSDITRNWLHVFFPQFGSPQKALLIYVHHKSRVNQV